MVIYRSQMVAHHNRANWARIASRELAAEVAGLEDCMRRGQEMEWAANDDPEAYDAALSDARLQAAERKERLITDAVIHGAAAIEGAFHGLAVAALGEDAARRLSGMNGAARKWSQLVEDVWGVNLPPNGAPLRSVGELFRSRNWLMHPNVVDVNTGRGVWEEVDVDGELMQTPVDLKDFTDLVDRKWDAAERCALAIEATFTELASCIDGYDATAGIAFELLPR